MTCSKHQRAGVGHDPKRGDLLLINPGDEHCGQGAPLQPSAAGWPVTSTTERSASATSLGPAKYRGNIWLNKRATPKRPPTGFLATRGLLPPPSPPVHDVTGEQSLQARDVPIGGSCQHPHGPRRQRDRDHLAALAGDHQGAVAALDTQGIDIGTGGLGDRSPFRASNEISARSAGSPRSAATSSAPISLRSSPVACDS